MATNLPSCFSIELLEQLLKFPVNFTLLKYVKSQRGYGFLITTELIFGFQILNLRLLTHVRLVRQNVLILSEVSLYVERSKNLEKKYVITVQKNSPS